MAQRVAADIEHACIDVTELNHVAFIDINYPQPWNMTANPVGLAALSAVRLRLDEFRRFLQNDQ